MLDLFDDSTHYTFEIIKNRKTYFQKFAKKIRKLILPVKCERQHQ